MGRSVDYLNRAERVNYFDWPLIWAYDEDTDQEVETDEYWDASEVIEDIQCSIIERYPEFSRCKDWDGRETQIILEGYGVQIGLSEYCGLATLSVRVNEDEIDYCEADEVIETQREGVLNWIHANWDDVSQYWNRYRKIGTFSNGEGVYEKAN
jgi:hypothetical protein